MEFKDAKVGDDVIVESHYNGKYISKIEAITPSGNFKITRHGLFKPDGFARATGWHCDRAVLATADDLLNLRKHWRTIKLRRRIMKNIDKIQLPELEKILAILPELLEAKP